MFAWRQNGGVDPFSVSGFAAALALGAAALAAPARAGLLWTVDSYVQEGLVLQLDGFANAGTDRPFSPRASVWRDIAGGDAGTIILSESDGSGWREDRHGLWLGGASHLQMRKTLPKSGEFTVEVHGDFPAEGQKCNWPNYVCAELNGKDFGVFTVWNATTLNWKTDSFAGTTSSTRPMLANWNGRHIAAVFAADSVSLGDGTRSVSKAAATTAPDPVRWYLGTGADAAATDSKKARYVVGLYQAFRVYDRPLSPEEIAHNLAVDEVRFGAGLPVTNAVVASAVEGLSGTEPDGAYAVDGSHVFTAPATAADSKGEVWDCAGASVSAWDSAARAWGAAETRPGRSVEVAADELVRIEWLWTRHGGTRGPASARYGLPSLLLRYDGLRNAGAGEPHDPAAETWADLSGNGFDAAMKIPEGKGEWSDVGFVFAGGAYGLVNNGLAVDFGSTLTIQVVSPADFSYLSSSVVSYPSFFGANSDYCNIYAHALDRGIYFKNDGTAGGAKAGNGGRPAKISFSEWGRGPYLSAVLDTAFDDAGKVSSVRSALYTGVVPSEAEWKTGLTGGVAVGTRVWSVGTGIDGSQNPAYLSARYLKGEIRAIRVYGAVLSEEESAAIREADDARLFGRPPATGCVLLATDDPRFEGEDPCDAYFPDGWTFKGGKTARKADGEWWRLSGVAVETWDAEGGTWGEPELLSGVSSWTAPKGRDWPSVRVTWNWGPSPLPTLLFVR